MTHGAWAQETRVEPIFDWKASPSQEARKPGFAPGYVPPTTREPAASRLAEAAARRAEKAQESDLEMGGELYLGMAWTF